MPHVVSDFSAIHGPSHNHGTRGRAAHADDRRPASPFSELVDAAGDAPAPRSGARASKSARASAPADDAPAPPVKDRGEPAPNGPANQARPAGETPPETAAPATDQQPTDQQATDDQAADTDPAAALQIALGLVEVPAAEPGTDATVAGEVAADAEDDKTVETDTIEAALVAAAPVDPNAPQPAAEAAAAVTAAPAPTEAPAPVPVPVPAPAPAETGENDAATAPADTIGAAPKGPAGDRPAPGAAKARGGMDAAAAGSKHADGSQQAGAAPANDDEPAATDTVAAKETDHDGGPSAPQSKTEHAHIRPGTIRPETSDSVSNQPSGASAGDAGNGARSPTETGQAAVTANDRLAAPTAATAASQSAADGTPVPLAGLAVEIAARAQTGRNRFEIRLDPPELGRIDVRLDIDTNGNVTSRLVVERVETLEALRRDASDLERALQQAGLKTSENGLQFSLRDQGFAGRDSNSDSPNAARLVVPDPALAPVDALQGGYGRMLRADGSVDIRV